jgi:hypothetical protein
MVATAVRTVGQVRRDPRVDAPFLQLHHGRMRQSELSEALSIDVED